MNNPLNSFYGQLEGYMTQIPVLGFNFDKYDINLVKQKLAIHLQMHVEEEHRPFVVKKENFLRLHFIPILQVIRFVPISFGRDVI